MPYVYREPNRVIQTRRFRIVTVGSALGTDVTDLVAMTKTIRTVITDKTRRTMITNKTNRTMVVR